MADGSLKPNEPLLPGLGVVQTNMFAVPLPASVAPKAPCLTCATKPVVAIPKTEPTQPTMPTVTPTQPTQPTHLKPSVPTVPTSNVLDQELMRLRQELVQQVASPSVPAVVPSTQPPPSTMPRPIITPAPAFVAPKELLWSQLGVGYVGMQPFTRPMIDGGLSGKMRGLPPNVAFGLDDVRKKAIDDIEQHAKEALNPEPPGGAAPLAPAQIEEVHKTVEELKYKINKETQTEEQVGVISVAAGLMLTGSLWDPCQRWKFAVQTVEVLAPNPPGDEEDPGPVRWVKQIWKDEKVKYAFRVRIPAADLAAADPGTTVEVTEVRVPSVVSSKEGENCELIVTTSTVRDSIEIGVAFKDPKCNRGCTYFILEIHTKVKVKDQKECTPVLDVLIHVNEL